MLYVCPYIVTTPFGLACLAAIMNIHGVYCDLIFHNLNFHLPCQCIITYVRLVCHLLGAAMLLIPYVIAH